MIIKTLHDDFHNTAKIDKYNSPAYYGGPIAAHYKLIVSADYANNDIYHISVYSSLGDALETLKRDFSCGTFK